MRVARTVLRCLLGSACVAALAITGPSGAASGARPAAPVPAALAALGLAPGDTYLYVDTARETQLLSVGTSKATDPQWVGRNYHGRPIVSRVYYTFDLTGVPAESITGVRFDNDQLFSPNRQCSLDSYGPGVQVATIGHLGARPKWPGPATTSAPVTDGYAVGSTIPCASGRRVQSWDVTAMVRAAAKRSPIVTLRLASANERDSKGYRVYNTEVNKTPQLMVSLRPHPNQPTQVAVDRLAAKSPAAPLVTYDRYATITAELTTPGGCPGTSSLSFCLGARFEVVDDQGKPFASGSIEDVYDTDGVAHLRLPIGVPLEEGVTYRASVWGVNTQTGLESLVPGATTFRYDAQPAVPHVTAVEPWQLDQPLLVDVTVPDADVTEVCWIVDNNTVTDGCATVTPNGTTRISLGQFSQVGFIDSRIWSIDAMGSEGGANNFQKVLSW